MTDRNHDQDYHDQVERVYRQLEKEVPAPHREAFSQSVTEVLDPTKKKEWSGRGIPPTDGDVRKAIKGRMKLRLKNQSRDQKKYESFDALQVFQEDPEGYAGELASRGVSHQTLKRLSNPLTPEDRFELSEELELVKDIYNDLNPSDRDVFEAALNSDNPERVPSRYIAKRLGRTVTSVDQSLSRGKATLEMSAKRARTLERCAEMQMLIPLLARGEMKGFQATRIRRHVLACRHGGCKQVARSYGITMPRVLIPLPSLFGLLDRLRGSEVTLAKTSVTASGATAGGSALLTAGSGKLAILGCTSVLCVGGIGLGVREVTKPTKPRTVKAKPNPAVVSGALASVGEELKREIKGSKKKKKKPKEAVSETQSSGNSQQTTNSQQVPKNEPVQVAHGNPEPDPAEVFEEDAEPVQVAHGNPEPDPSEVFGEDAKP